MKATKSIVLFNEWDSDLKENLRLVLRQLGAKVVDGDWALGGSQELGVVEVKLGNGTLRIEAETYIGLSISGPSELVDQVQALLGGVSGPQEA